MARHYWDMSAARLQSLLGLSDEELLRILGSDPLAVITGEEDQRPDITLLVELLQEQAGNPALQRWVRTQTPHGTPLELLKAHDFAAFEDALADLGERGFIVSRRDPGASRQARSR
jgi:hypothetical protein